MKKEKILIAGGDMRQLYCGLRLAQGHDTAVIGFDDKYTSPHASLKKADHDTLYDCVVFPVPPLTEDGFLSTPCGNEKLSLARIKDMVKPCGKVFTGRNDSRLQEAFADSEIINYMELEEVSLLNAIPTAEGAVQIALDELPVTLSGLRVMIVGCGRIGTALINILKGFGADITVAVRNAKGSAKAKIAGVKSVCTRDMAAEYDLIFNTVPSLIFDRKVLEKFGTDTLFIDLASKPGGIDFDCAAELGIRAIWALGLPGKTAPVTSGEIIADSISGILAERGEADE